MTSTAWSYDSSLFSTSTGTQATMIVRRLIGDVLSGNPQLQDGEINFAIAEWSNYYLAGAECCRWLSAQYSREVDLVQGDLKTNYSNKAKAYRDRATELETLGNTRGAAGAGLAYAGGISVQDKIAQENDPDRVDPQYNLGMQDNTLPTGIVGNETPGNPTTGGDGV